MKEYSTYQEAAIANLGSLIFKSSEFFYAFNCDCGAIATDGSLTLCDHADYCISVSEFLSKGNRANDGDLVIDSSGDVWEVKDCDSDLGVNNFTGSKAKNSYVLRAAALEKPLLQTGESFEHTKTLNFIRDRLVEVHGEPKNLDYMHKLNNVIAFVERMEDAKVSNDGFESVAVKEAQIDMGDCAISAKVDESLFNIDIEMPRRTKVEYVKVDYSISWQAAKDHEERTEFLYRQSDLNDAIKGNNWKAIQSPSEAARYYFDLYRRVETEINDREEFIASACKVQESEHGERREYLVAALFDSGKFKLVD